MRLRRVLWNPKYKEYTWIVRLDTPSEGIWTTYPGRNCTRLPPFTPGCAPPFVFDCRHLYLDARRHLASGCGHLHPAAAHFPPPDIHIWNFDAEWERRRFNFSGRTYPDYLIAAYLDGRAAILHSAAVFSWSFLLFPTDILRYLPPIFWDILL